MYILGISAYYHDSAAALIKDDVIMAAAQEERFTRKRHDPAFPAHAVRFCLDHAGIALDDVDAVVFYDKPFLKFERLLETYYAFAPKGLTSFLTSMPVWLKEKLFLKRMLFEELSKIAGGDGHVRKLLFAEHHLSHAASAFYPSPFDEAAILTIDGVGEWATASICHGKGSRITVLKELRFPHSVGLLYSAFTWYMGFKVNSGEYKLMGLAPYGNPGSPDVARFADLIRGSIVRIFDDGSIWLDQQYFDYATGLKMVDEGRWEQLLGIGPRRPEGDLTQAHCDLALAMQQVTEEIVLKMAAEARRLTGCRNLCMAGGVALNCVANGKLLRSGMFGDIWIQPASGDAGGALGAAYSGLYVHAGADRTASGDRMQGSYLGPEFGDIDIQRLARKYGAPSRLYHDTGELCADVARIIADGSVVGWFQGRMEWGPRALGNRSIIADPRNPEMQRKLNLKIKFREGFRPFAPSVLAEEERTYFDTDVPSPYMLLIADVLEERRTALPEGYHRLGWKEKLYHLRSDLPSITHIDFSARLQTVHKETNPRYWTLIDQFRRLTGYGVIVNTSFNVRGEPIVCTPEDAYRCFMRTDMDYLVINDRLFCKSEQPVLVEEGDWRKEFTLD